MFSNYPMYVHDSNDGFGNGGGWVWIILILVILCGGWNNGGWAGFGGFGGGSNTSVYEGYVLNNDFSVLSNQMGQGFASQERKLDSISNGICSLGYDQLAQMNGINTNIMSGVNTLQAAIKDCCCQTQQNIKDTQYAVGSTGADISRGVERGFSDTNYNLATQANALSTTVANGFCQSNFNAQTNTRDIIDSQNANTRAILEAIQSNKVEALKDRIAEQNQTISALNLAASQQAQNNYIVSTLEDKLSPCPKPAYWVPNPNGCNCACNNVYPYGYGTTIA